MRFSVVTVCYNSANTIERTIQSMQRQNYADWEHIIVDGASTDGTKEVLDRYVNAPRLKIISEKDDGPYDAMNKGIKAANGDVISFLNADDYYLHEKVLEMVYHKINGFPKADVYYGDLLVVDCNAPTPYIKVHDSVDRYYMCTNALAHPSMFHKKHSFEKAGLFDLKYKIVADYEWTLRAMYKNMLRFCYFDVVTTVFSAGGLSTGTAHEKKHSEEREAVVNEFFSREEQRRFNSAIKRKSVQVRKGLKLINYLTRRFFGR